MAQGSICSGISVRKRGAGSLNCIANKNYIRTQTLPIEGCRLENWEVITWLISGEWVLFIYVGIYLNSSILAMNSFAFADQPTKS